MSAELFTALAKAQAEFPQIARTKRVTVKTKTGGSYSFEYAPLDAIFAAVRPVLAKHGLSFSQLLTEGANGGPAILNVLGHSSGGSLQGIVPLPVSSGMSAQEFGSLVTYYKRYGLVSALGIATEDDDDGNHASGNVARTSGGAAMPTTPPPSDDIPFAPDIPFSPPATDGEPSITAPQLKFLRTLAEKLIKAEKQTVEGFRARLDAEYGVTSTKALTKKQATVEIEHLKGEAVKAGLIEE